MKLGGEVKLRAIIYLFAFAVLPDDALQAGLQIDCNSGDAKELQTRKEQDWNIETLI